MFPVVSGGVAVERSTVALVSYSHMETLGRVTRSWIPHGSQTLSKRPVMVLYVLHLLSREIKMKQALRSTVVLQETALLVVCL